LTTLATGSLSRGLMAGLGAYGGAGLAENLMGAGGNALVAGGAPIGAENVAGAAVPPIEQVNPSNFNLSAADKFSAGAKAVTASPEAFGSFAKQNLGNLAYAAAPIAAGLMVPTTTKLPDPRDSGLIRQMAFNIDPDTGKPDPLYGMREMTPVKASEFGNKTFKGQRDLFYQQNPNPYELGVGSLNQPPQQQQQQQTTPMASGGIVALAGGGVPGYAGNQGSLVSDADIFKYFQTPNLSDTQIAADMQKYGVSAADIARATGTQNQQADYEKRFVNTLLTPTTDSSEFLKATGGVGLQGQALTDALNSAGVSQGAQYALTQPGLSDAGFTGGIIDAGTGKAVDLYNQIGYTAGALPGDKGGLEGLYGNINYVTTGLQNLINTGKMSVADAQNAALAELKRTKVGVEDVETATGKKFGNLFTGRPVVKDTVTGAIGNDVITKSGYYTNDDGVLVPNISSTQNTSTNVTTPTGINVADASALPVGVSGAGITTINPNGTITTRPDLSLEMQDVRDAYTAGGGSLGVNKNLFAPTTYKQIEDRYKLTGGSKQAMDYLTGKTKYTPIPYTEDGQISKSYAESVMKIPVASSSKMYIFKNGRYEVNPDYAIPTYDKDGKKSLNLTNADVKTFMDAKPSTDAFYTWATTNNLSPEQIALASDRPINEISKLFTGAKDLVGEDGKIDQAKLDEKTAEDEKTNFDYVAYLKANPDVQAELDAGKANFGTKDDPAAAAYEHYLRYGKAGGRKYTKKAANGGLMNMAMARGGMSQQFDLGGYSDGGRLLRGPGDGVSDSIPATIGNKRPARLADGEFVVPARIVSELGNGSTEAGARKLYAMMDRVQSARRGTVGKGRVAKNSRSDKYLPA